MGERYKPTPQQDILAATEPIAVVNNRKIAVIATNHGNFTPYPGKEQAEADIESFEDKYGKITTIAQDSNSKLENLDIFYTKFGNGSEKFNLETGYPELHEFSNFAVLLAAKRNIPFIACDPLGLSFEMYKLFNDNMEIYDNQREVVEVYNEAIETHPEGSFSEQGANLIERVRIKNAVDTFHKLIAVSSMGVAIMNGRHLVKKKFSRRDLLKLGAGIGLLSAVNIAANLSQGFQEKIIDELDIYQTDSVPADEENTVFQFQTDIAEAEQYLHSPGEITPEFFESGAFKRLAYLHSKTVAYTVNLRNALIAEVLSAPMPSVQKEGEEERIPVIMGSGHTMVNEEYRISYLLTHADVRRTTLKNLLTAFSKGSALKGEYRYRDSLFHSLKTYPRVYNINSDGSFTTTPIDVPAIREIIDSIQ